MHGGIELDAFTVGQTEHLVVIKHSVHVLYPEGVHWAVTNNPLVVLSGVLQGRRREGEGGRGGGEEAGESEDGEGKRRERNDGGKRRDSTGLRTESERGSVCAANVHCTTWSG